MALLEVSNLGIAFGGLQAVAQLDLSIEKGHLYGLIGPNGAGKTTVFNMLTGVYKPTEGNIVLDGKDITGLSTRKILQEGINFVPEDRHYHGLFKIRSISSNTTSALLSSSARPDTPSGSSVHSSLSARESNSFSVYTWPSDQYSEVDAPF